MRELLSSQTSRTVFDPAASMYEPLPERHPMLQADMGHHSARKSSYAINANARTGLSSAHLDVR